jgi:hypothetical protein
MKETQHPETGEWELATWIDDYFGNHNYGVQFRSDRANPDPLKRVVYDPREVKLKTRETTDDGKVIENTQHPDGRKDVTVQVNRLDVNETDEATVKAKEHIEEKILPEIANQKMTCTLIHKPTNDHFSFVTSRKNVKANTDVSVKAHAQKMGTTGINREEYCLVENDGNGHITVSSGS